MEHSQTSKVHNSLILKGKFRKIQARWVLIAYPPLLSMGITCHEQPKPSHAAPQIPDLRHHPAPLSHRRPQNPPLASWPETLFPVPAPARRLSQSGKLLAKKAVFLLRRIHAF